MKNLKYILSLILLTMSIQGYCQQMYDRSGSYEGKVDSGGGMTAPEVISATNVTESSTTARALTLVIQRMKSSMTNMAVTSVTSVATTSITVLAH